MSSRNSTYAIGHKSLDADHEAIIGLWRTLEATKTMDAARNAAVRLMDETLGHFSREEVFMAQCGFPHLAEHRASHQDLAGKLRRIILSSNSHKDFVGAICTLMERWVTVHIVVDDAKIAPYARALAERMAKALSQQAAARRS